MLSLKELAERRKMTADEVSVADQEAEKIAKTLNELAATGRDLKAAGLMDKVEENQAVQEAMQNFRHEFGFKTQLEQAAMRFGRLQKRIPAVIKQSRTAPEHLRTDIQTLSIQVRQFDKKVAKSGLRSEDIQELTGFEAKLADLEPQLESVI